MNTASHPQWAALVAAIRDRSIVDPAARLWVLNSWRATRLLPALLQGPKTRHEVGEITHCSNAPDFVMRVRRRLGIDLPCTAMTAADRHGNLRVQGVYRLTPRDARIVQRYMDEFDATLLGTEADTLGVDQRSPAAGCMSARELRDAVHAWIYSNGHTAMARAYLRCLLYIASAVTVSDIKPEDRLVFLMEVQAACFPVVGGDA